MSPMDDLAVREWCNSTLLKTPRLQLVSKFGFPVWFETNSWKAKFTGYQYGGRPLGLTYVKYVNAGSGDAMEGAEPTGQNEVM